MTPCFVQANILELEYVNNQKLESRVRTSLSACFAVLFWTLASVASSADTRLLMIGSNGCSYCAQWEREVGGIYPLTEEGKLAPVDRINIHSTLPEGVILSRKAVYTPTFVLLRDGVEVDRIEGYPGEAFFWGLLDRMIHKVDAAALKS